MGWGLIIPQVYYNRIRKDELENRKEDLDKIIRIYREKLFMWASCNPDSIKYETEEYDNAIEFIHFQIKQILDEYEESVSELQLCEIAIANKDELIDG